MKKFTSEEIKKFVSKPLFDEKIILNKDPSWPKITIVTPSFNQSQFLERTILSVLNQNYQNLEYIIIDGGSADGSVEIIKKYKKYLDYWISEKDKGQSHALNKGFKLCTGEYIGWQNSDDIYLPNVFEEFAKISDQFPDYDIYYSNRLNIDENENVINKVYYVSPSWPYIKYYSKYRGMALCNQTSFLRKNILEKVGYIDESLKIAMDTDFFLRCVLQKKRFYYVNSFWGGFRRHICAKTCKIDIQGHERKSEREYIIKKHSIYRGRLSPFISLVMAMWRVSLFIASGNWRGFWERCKLRWMRE